MASVRTRVRDLVKAEILTLGAGVKHVAIDLLGFEQLTGDKFPAVFIIIGSGGAIEYGTSRWIREELPFDVIGYVKVGTGLSVADAREAFYQLVFNKLTGQSMEDRINTDYANNNKQGAILLRHSGAPETDEGQAPPFGFFILPVTAVIHYKMASL